MQRAYYYLGGDALHTGIYVDLIRRLEEEDLVVHLVPRLRVSPNPASLIHAWRNRHLLGPNRIEAIRGQIRGEVHPLPVWNLAPGLSGPRLARIAGLPGRGERRVVMHARQIVMALLALTLKRRWPDLRVIAELEGDDLAQLECHQSKTPRPSPSLRLRWSLERSYYQRAYRRILRESDAVNCVSKNLRDAVVRRCGLNGAQAARLHVIPTIASRKEFFFDPDRRDRTRRALALEDRFVVIYSGNLRGPWQRPDQMVEAFRMIRQCRSTAFFLVLTGEAERSIIEPHLSRAGIAPEDHRVTSCPHREVGDHLCAADVGLILLDRHPATEAGAPTKLGEYALSGLPIVMTDGVGDFSAEMRDVEWACVLPDLTDREAMRDRIQRFCGLDFTPARRAAFSAWASERFATEISVPRLAQLYRSV
jgi:hypothetical protein